jgi:hypothetical protein
LRLAERLRVLGEAQSLSITREDLELISLAGGALAAMYFRCRDAEAKLKTHADE